MPPGESDPEDLERVLLEGRMCEIRMLFYLGKDLHRWIEQCVDFADRVEELTAAGLTFDSFAELLIHDPPALVREKLQKWGVGDYQAIFSRAIALRTLFAELPSEEVLSPEFVRNYFRYTDHVYACRQELCSLRKISSANFDFELVRLRRILAAARTRVGLTPSTAPAAPRSYNRGMDLSPLVLVRQKFPDRRIADVRAEVLKQLASPVSLRRSRTGARVAIGVGSRGIANIATIVARWSTTGRRRARRPSFSRPWEATARRRPRARPTCSPTTASTRQRWAVQSSASSRWSRSARPATASKPSWTARPSKRRRHAGGPRQMAHRLCGQDRERPVQDDGDRARQVRRGAALSHLCLQARAGTRDPQRRAPGAEIGQDPRRPRDPGGRPSQHRRS